MDIFLSLAPSIFSIIAVILLLMLLLKSTTKNAAKSEQTVREELRLGRDESARAAKDLRDEVATSLNASAETVSRTISEMGKLHMNNLEAVEKRVMELTTSNEDRLERVRTTIDTQMKSLQENNEKKLDQMRQTVDEKLQSTLEKRLGESFSIVSKQLEAVQRGLGEMHNLATGVGDLQRVLTNVKARGTWGEVQLGAILEQILTPNQYAKNVPTKNGSNDRVEYAIKLPGSDMDQNTNIWLPIDAKFPQEDYQRLLSAVEAADTASVDQAQAALIRSIKSSAKEISDKYVDPPGTTDFAFMFLPTEGLYAEVLRQPGLIEDLQQTCRVVITGPTTLSATINCLKMGFRTLAIDKRSSEVWKVLEAVKTEFNKFGAVLDKVKNQLNAASNTIEKTSQRTRAMTKKLRDVEELPSEDSEKIFGLSGGIMDEIDSGESDEEI